MEEIITDLDNQEVEMVSGGGTKCRIVLSCDSNGECEAKLVCSFQL